MCRTSGVDSEECRDDFIHNDKQGIVAYVLRLGSSLIALTSPSKVLDCFNRRRVATPP